MNTELLKVTRAKNLAIYYRAHVKDSLLLLNKNATEIEFDRSQLSYLNSKESMQSVSIELNNIQQVIDEYQNSLQRYKLFLAMIYYFTLQLFDYSYASDVEVIYC